MIIGSQLDGSAWSVARVAAALVRPTATFSELLEHLDGQYPGDALAALRWLSENDATRSVLASRLIADAVTESTRPATSDQIDCLPLPHPSDYEWRFTDDTAADVLDRVSRATPEDGLTLLVGMPSLVVAAASDAKRRRMVVLGTDDIVWDTLRTHVANDPRFEDATSTTEAAAAVVDPPWYPRAYRELFAAFATRCRIGAHVFVGAPPAGARPSATSDIEEIIALAATFGFALIGNERGVLRYRSPAFELSAFRRAGINAHLPHWRRGDLLVFEKRQSHYPPSSAPNRPVAFEVTLAGVRLRLTPAACARGKALTMIGDTDVYPTVSTRTPRRGVANLWTSGNRAYEVDAVTALAALSALAQSQGALAKPPTQLEKLIALSEYSPTQSLMTQLQEVAATETTEMEMLVGGMSWLRSVNDARFLNGSLSDFLGNLAGAAGSETNC